MEKKMPHAEIEIDLSCFSAEDLAAIEAIAVQRGISFDEAVKQIALEEIKRRRKLPQKRTLARVFRFRSAH
jgi:hypothetical protein